MGAEKLVRLNCRQMFVLVSRRLCIVGMILFLTPTLAACVDPDKPEVQRSPKPIPEEIVLKAEKFMLERSSVACKDLNAACVMSAKFLEELEDALGANHWLVVEERKYISDLQRFANESPSVQEQLKRALDVQFSAELLMKKRQFEVSRKLIIEKSLPVWEMHARGGIYHKNAVHHCALLSHQLGDVHSAKQMASKSVRLSRDLFGEDHFVYGHCVLTEGAVDLALRDYQSAEDRFIEASEILSRNCTKQHVILGLPYAYLSVLYLETDKYEKAVLFARKTVEATEIRSLPQDENSIALNFGVVAVKLIEARGHAEAEIALNALLETAENSFAQSPSAALGDYYQLKAINFGYLNRHDEAKQAQRKANEYRAMSKTP